MVSASGEREKGFRLTTSTHQEPTDEKPINDLWMRKLNDIFETRNMRLSQVDESLRCLDEAHPSMEIYRNYFYLLAHLEFDEADAVRHWDDFKTYHDKFETDLGYPIDTRITTLSYFINENKQLTSPKIIEMKVFQSTQERVIMDELTSLYNFRHFRERIKTEMECALEREETLSLVIIDIDDFKHINDDYGHLTGDGILRQIAALIKAEISDRGDTFRYGGEEFAVILPRTAKQEAYSLSSTLCEAIAEKTFINENATPRHDMSVTASLGIATYPQDCDSANLLISNADKALYNAKGSGKNIACLFSENERRFKRLNTSIQGELANFATASVGIRTLNVSRGGIRFLCEEDLPRDAIVQLKLESGKNSEFVTLLCRIINKSTDVDSFIYGTEVVQIDRRDRVRFNRLVDSLPNV